MQQQPGTIKYRRPWLGTVRAGALFGRRRFHKSGKNCNWPVLRDPASARIKACQSGAGKAVRSIAPPLVTLRRSDADLEQALFKPIATIGDVASLE
jgi:hypothetical protein